MKTEGKGEYVSNYADVTVYPLTEEGEATLLKKQTECTFMWTNSQGEPIGVMLLPIRGQRCCMKMQRPMHG